MQGPSPFSVRQPRDVFQTTPEAEVWVERALAPLYEEEAAFIHKHVVDRHAAILEGGCGAGRICFNLEKLGYRNVQGFDYSEVMVREAERRRPEGSAVKFHLADATRLEAFDDESFDYLVYLQQFICTIPREQIPLAMRHAYRILRPGGVAVLSAMKFPGRRMNIPLSLVINVFRLLRGERPDLQSLPWMSFGGRPNHRWWARGQPAIYWFRPRQLVSMLENVGFEVFDWITDRDLRGDRARPMCQYVACRRPTS